MLIAVDNIGKFVNLAEKDKQQIDTLKNKKWFCPGCKEEVIIKNGSILCAHFAHKNKCSCDIFSENESKEHLLGKKLIADNCRKFRIPYEVEAFLPELNQRPDILINKEIAIEFQCSSLSIERFMERTKNYQKHGYQVIWLLGMKLHLTSKISNLQKNFIYLSKNIGFYVWELDVVEKKVMTNFFLSDSPSGFLNQRKGWQLSDENFLTILKYPQTAQEMLAYEIDSKLNFSKQKNLWNLQLNQKQKNVMTLQSYFYQKNLNLRELSGVSIFPSFQSVVLSEKELILRHLVYEFLEVNLKGTKEEINDYVTQELEKHLHLEYLLIGKRKLVSYHVSLYLCFLLQSDVIDVKNDDYFFKKEWEQKNLDFKKEFLGIPLKYVMINK